MTDEVNNLIYGLHAVSSALIQHRVIELFVQEGQRSSEAINTLIAQAKAANIPQDVRDKKFFQNLLGDVRHQRVAAMVNPMRQYTEADVLAWVEETKNPLILLLDGVQDPHNLGACLRSAEAAGVLAVIAPKDKNVGLTAAVKKVACGAADRVPFIPVTNLVRIMEKLQALGVWIYGTAGEADVFIYQQDLKGAVGLVMGAEGAGLRRLTRERCDGLIKIPMQGAMPSLNVSVATGICLFEVIRQRHVEAK